tara:strand:+ start:1932 stop:2906 length:975 start_codon:yes stop_codon:yes gene_type:complete
MNWFTEIPIKNPPFKFGYDDQFFTIGSCFSDHLAHKLLRYKYTCVNNPFGTFFHPIPLLNNLRESLQNKPIDSSLFVERDFTFFHYSYHSSIWSLTKEDLLSKLCIIQSTIKKQIQNTNLLVITFGTAFLYRISDSMKEIANCHKMPSYNFSKDLSNPLEIELAFKDFYEEVKLQNPKIKILISVSPVRHIRGGFHKNNLSKASLLLACETIKNSYSDVHYFPAYEIMLDELRDYRFFKKDKVHPTNESIDYVWYKFSNTFLNKESLDLIKNLETLYTSLNHRPYNKSSIAHQSFLQKILIDAQQLNTKVNLLDEITELKNRII